MVTAVTAFSVLDRGHAGVDLLATWPTARGWDTSVAVEFPYGSASAASLVAGALTRFSVRAWECLVCHEWDDRVSDACVDALDGHDVGAIANWPVVVLEAERLGRWVRDTEQFLSTRVEVIREINALNESVRASFKGRSFQALLCDRRIADRDEIVEVHRWLVEWGDQEIAPDLADLRDGVNSVDVSDDARAAAVAKWMAAAQFIAEQAGTAAAYTAGGVGEAVAAAVGVHGRPITTVAAGVAAVIGADRMVGELVDAFILGCKTLAAEHGGEAADVAVWIAEGLAVTID